MALVVGIDLGRKSAHDVAVFRWETGRQVGRGFRFGSTCVGFDTLFERVAEVREAGEDVEFVIDSPGRAWIPVATVLRNRGYDVYRPTASLVASIRRGVSGKNKTNQIDARALAKCRMNNPDEVSQVYLPSGTGAKLDQIVRWRDRLVDAIRRRKQRIQDIPEAIAPGLVPAMGSFVLSQAGRAFLRSYLIPKRAVRSGKKRLFTFLQKHYTRPLAPERVDAIHEACEDAAALYEQVRQAGQMPFDEHLLQEEMRAELDQLERDEAVLRDLEKRIEALNKKLDPTDALISMPGIRHVLGGSIRSVIGDIDRFPSLTGHRDYAGFYPTANRTGDGPRSKSSDICQMSSSRYRRYLYLAAENAYRWDVDMAAFYHKKREHGFNHIQAVCAVANAKLIPRIHHLLKAIRQAQRTGAETPHYVFRDLSGNPISKKEARTIITATWGEAEYN